MIWGMKKSQYYFVRWFLITHHFFLNFNVLFLQYPSSVIKWNFPHLRFYIFYCWHTQVLFNEMSIKSTLFRLKICHNTHFCHICNMFKYPLLRKHRESFYGRCPWRPKRQGQCWAFMLSLQLFAVENLLAGRNVGSFWWKPHNRQ